MGVLPLASLLLHVEREEPVRRRKLPSCRRRRPRCRACRRRRCGGRPLPFELPRERRVAGECRGQRDQPVQPVRRRERPAAAGSGGTDHLRRDGLADNTCLQLHKISDSILHRKQTVVIQQPPAPWTRSNRACRPASSSIEIASTGGGICARSRSASRLASSRSSLASSISRVITLTIAAAVADGTGAAAAAAAPRTAMSLLCSTDWLPAAVAAAGLTVGCGAGGGAAEEEERAASADLPTPSTRPRSPISFVSASTC